MEAISISIISIGSVYWGLQLGSTNVYDVVEVYLSFFSVLTFLVTLMVFSPLQRNLYDNVLLICHQKVAHIKVVLLRFYAPQTDHSFKSYTFQGKL